MQKTIRIFTLVLFPVLLSCVGESGEGSSSESDTGNGSSFSVSSTSIASNGTIANAYAHNLLGGGYSNISPQLSWQNAPSGTTHFSVLFEDNDAAGWIHWILYNIPAGTTELAENISNGTLPAGSTQVDNSFGAGDTTGYGGPAPPSGTTHTYKITVYALNQQLTFGSTPNNSTFKTEADSKKLATASFSATFTSP